MSYYLSLNLQSSMRQEWCHLFSSFRFMLLAAKTQKPPPRNNVSFAIGSRTTTD